METDWRRVYIVKLDVLIVPCGMETLEAQKALEIANGINCTLRNGNRSTRRITSTISYVLIVPCGMETKYGACKD